MIGPGGFMATSKQPIFTPQIKNCAKCGSTARLIDWDFRSAWRVMCEHGHVCTGEFLTKNRAVWRWNNKQVAIENKLDK